MTGSVSDDEFPLKPAKGMYRRTSFKRPGGAARVSDALNHALRAPRLSLVMLVLFVCFSIPILIFILVYNYQRNVAAMVSTLDKAVATTT